MKRIGTPEAQARRRRFLSIAFHQLPEDTRFTCDRCDAAPTCDSAFDPYNIGDSDCLEEK
jgi:hypothetical protein